VVGERVGGADRHHVALLQRGDVVDEAHRAALPGRDALPGEVEAAGEHRRAEVVQRGGAVVADDVDDHVDGAGVVEDADLPAADLGVVLVRDRVAGVEVDRRHRGQGPAGGEDPQVRRGGRAGHGDVDVDGAGVGGDRAARDGEGEGLAGGELADRKSTRLNS